MKYLLTFGLVLLLTGVAHAEGECPPGMFPTNPPGAQGPVGCAPIPGYNNNQRQAQPQLPSPQWARRWGSIATDSINGSLGTTVGQSSQREAEQSAMADCLKKGGVQCKIQTTYDNECAAMILGDKEFNVGTAANLDKAVQLGIKVCTDAGDTNCHVYYSACSLPVQIQ
ncbi:MAG: DUF4189 domain-containing protein [Rhodanobacter sp.]